jgi:hypothetical protein
VNVARANQLSLAPASASTAVAMCSPSRSWSIRSGAASVSSMRRSMACDQAERISSSPRAQGSLPRSSIVAAPTRGLVRNGAASSPGNARGANGGAGCGMPGSSWPRLPPASLA